jgi:hypothetical protein
LEHRFATARVNYFWCFKFGKNLVGLGRFELPTTGLGNGLVFAKSFGVIVFGLERVVLFRAGSEI